ncbi:PP2C family serine/threonine-protein phosphatase [Allobaculum sp. Allo2]|uniref:PP2C family protein-serine/threonine phosphatase n=1 Tax=Allobaculum sp. Allo2 TaxID=2853432 RepID=UPI001F621F93|nr:protein phosphatase 2C domain-containing protein [Allobaculum sp. Allo2]
MTEVYGLTDIGKSRDLNEDSFLIARNRHGALLLMVCDGIGGAVSGEVASAMACQIAKSSLKAPRFLKRTIRSMTGFIRR